MAAAAAAVVVVAAAEEEEAAAEAEGRAGPTPACPPARARPPVASRPPLRWAALLVGGKSSPGRRGKDGAPGPLLRSKPDGTGGLEPRRPRVVLGL